MSGSFAARALPAVAAFIICAPLMHAQANGQAAKAASEPASAPAPRHDISGLWFPAGFAVGDRGASNMPEDGKPEHQLPYTPAALEKMKTMYPGNGTREVPATKINDPAVIYCDPQGMPRQDLYELRATQIMQTPAKVFVMYQWGRIWRYIWQDGREIPKDPDPKWFGTSVGKWEDDYTFVATTVGVDDRTWLDKGGRPLSDQMVVEERFHRLSADRMQFTVTVNDPKMYSKPWVALNVPMRLLPDNTDVPEMMCSVSEFMQYNQKMGWGNPTALYGGK